MYSKRTPDYFSTDIDWKACDTVYPEGKQSYLNQFFPDGIKSISFKARPSQSGVDCHINAIPEPPITVVDSGGWFDKVIKDWGSFVKDPTAFCDLKTSFSVDWISELLDKYKSVATKYRRSQRDNLWSKFVNDPGVLMTLSEDVPYISNKSIYCYLNLAADSIKKRPKTHDNYDVNLFLSFLCASIRSSPIVYFSLCNLAETGSKSFCYNDFCANNAKAMMNVFGEYKIKQNVKLEGVFPTLTQPFAHKVIPFLAVAYPETIPLKKWDTKHIDMILDLFLLYRESADITDGGKLRRLIIQFFMIMDNIHDFGKPRPPYKPSDICGDPRCITEILIKLLNGKLKEIGDFYERRGGKSHFLALFHNIDNFGQGFEASLLWQLIDSGRFEEYVTVCPKTNNLANAMKNKSILWTTDTTRLERKLIIALKRGSVKTRLNTAMFDGFVGSDPVEPGDGKTNFTEMKPFYIPLTYSDGEVSYSTPITERMPKGALDRHFPDKYGRGGLNMKNCTDSKTCFLRADIISNQEAVPAGNVNDHVAQLGEIIGRIYKEKGDPGFFFTLKSLGDFAQVIEAKERGIVLITQDSLEFLAGVLVGAMVIKANRFGKGWVLSQPLFKELRGCGDGGGFGGGVMADTKDTIGFGGMDMEVDDGFAPVLHK